MVFLDTTVVVVALAVMDILCASIVCVSVRGVRDSDDDDDDDDEDEDEDEDEDGWIGRTFGGHTPPHTSRRAWSRSVHDARVGRSPRPRSGV